MVLSPALAVLLVPGAVQAQRTVPLPPVAPTQSYQPDQQGCSPERLLSGFKRGLAPYADQPPAVLEKLASLQRQLTAGSLKVCLDKGLLSPAQVERLIEAMGLALPPPGPALAPPQPTEAEPGAPSQAQPRALPLRAVPPGSAPAMPSGSPPTAPPTKAPGPRATPSAFDMSPIEWSPLRPTPREPNTQQDSSASPR
ncbi:hypothetical protein [Cyanobium sp. Morenito 9A2]|uniref:hypothetical protein n=1 Tax=Cyanobium sp. Morenito 9A2 TaxID=2823718 RepID=UPI0020CF60BF|nr:hypothetical protein [Cyanobium sp. Morenito 9A2]MCP9850530.1 hypothetical protein [Cyanobium sp. Morenito 9A2]